jgi:hypothetical protein
MTVKKCRVCNLDKLIENFSKRKTSKGTIYYRTECKLCRKISNKSYYNDNKEDIIAANISYRKNNQHRRNNLIKIRKSKDISFKINSNIRSLVKMTISRNGGSKGGAPTLKNLTYSINELKIHLEEQFEPWMSWNNWGVYNSKTWNDNDSTTWTWQLDHIIPQSDLPYYSLSDENFKKCWSLNNLRPLSAKQNIIEGVRRLRHGSF